MAAWESAPVVEQAPAWASAPIVDEPPQKQQSAPRTTGQEFMRQVGLKGREIAEGITSVPNALLSGVGGLYNTAADALHDLRSPTQSELITGKQKGYRVPDQAQVFSQTLTRLGLPEHETPTERITGAITSGVAGVGGPIAAGQKVAQLAPLAVAPAMQATSAASAALSQQGASELGIKNPAALFVIGLAGGSLPALLKTIPGWAQKNSGKLLNDALNDTTDAEWAQAERLLKQGREAGVPLMGPEGFREHSPVQQLASATQASSTGGQAMRRVLQERVPRMESAAQEQLSKVGRNVGTQEAANAAQEAATKVIRGEEQARTAAASPYYQAAQSHTVSVDHRLPFYQAIDDAAAATGSADIKGNLTKLQADLNAAGDNVGKLSDVIKVWRSKIDAPPIRQDALDKNSARVLGGVLNKVEDSIRAASPEYVQGKRVFQQRTDMVLDPLNQGPVGKVAGVGFEPDKAATPQRVLSEFGGKEATPERIRKLASELRREDPTAFPNAARAYLEQRFAEAFTDIQSGPNRMAGVNFRNVIAGNMQERQNLRAVIEEVARTQGQNPDEVWTGFRKMLDVFEATGKIPGVGSQTQPRQELAKMARESKVAGAMETVSLNPLNSVAEKWRDLIYRGAYRELGEAFTAPDAIEKMRKLASLRPDTPAAAQITWSILMTAGRGAEPASGPGMSK